MPWGVGLRMLSLSFCWPRGNQLSELPLAIKQEMRGSVFLATSTGLYCIRHLAYRAR